MLTEHQQFEDETQVQDYIYKRLCDHCQLQEGAFPMTRRVLRRGGRPCAVYFCIHGPRATRFTAIWETEQNRVFFYDSDGMRFGQTVLQTALRRELAAA